MKKRRRAVGVGLLLLVLGLGVWFSGIHKGPAFGHHLPGNIRPELRVGEKMYYWAGMSTELHGAISGPDYAVSGLTFLPGGYTPYGALRTVTKGEASQDCQMKAGFDASGTIYVSEKTPEAVYVLISSDCDFNGYARFVSPALDQGTCIAWNGNRYRIGGAGDGICEELRELPENAKKIGQLHFIGPDAIPEHDFEINRAGDSSGHTFEGREVFFDPEKPGYIYVYERQYWREGEYDSYLACPIWKE